MNQPELGKKIASLRKEKGLTQEELISKCNISVRTLQRIENGVVVPRSYTIKAIFAALDYPVYDSTEGSLKKEIIYDGSLSWIKDLFNLKTNKMKKLSILITFSLFIVVSLFAVCENCVAQKKTENQYVQNNSRGITYLFPRGLNRYGTSNTGDTAYYWAGNDIIKEYKGDIFLNGKYIDHAVEGDTVFMKKGNVLRKVSLYIRRYQPNIFRSFNKKGIVYAFPDLSLSYASRLDSETYVLEEYYTIKEKYNKIYLNDKFMGEAYQNDTVYLSPRGILSIYKAK